MLRLFVTTKDVKPNERLDYWNAFVETVYPGLSVSSTKTIEANWVSRTIGELRVARAVSPRALIQRWKRIPAEDAANRIVVHLQSGGSSVFCQERSATMTKAGDVAVCSSAIPYEIHASDGNVVIVIDFPSEFLGDPAPAPCTCPGNSTKRLHDFALAVLDEGISDLEVEEGGEEIVRDVFATLLGSCMNAESAEAADVSMESRRIFDYIDRSIGNSALRTSLIADRLSLSVKRVQRTFAEVGTTPSQFIVKRRVHLAAAMLRSRSFDGRITDVAMEVGFTDSAHLSRSFRKHTGMSPRQYAASYRP